jgi:hypothetical protein
MDRSASRRRLKEPPRLYVAIVEWTGHSTHEAIIDHLETLTVIAKAPLTLEWGVIDDECRDLLAELHHSGSADWDFETAKKCEALIAGVTRYLNAKKKRQEEKEARISSAARPV